MALKKLRSYIIKKYSSGFNKNHLKSNAGTCNLITSSTLPTEIQIENAIISCVNRVKNFLGVHNDGRPDFVYHVSQICNKGSKNINALSNSVDTGRKLNEHKIEFKLNVLDVF